MTMQETGTQQERRGAPCRENGSKLGVLKARRVRQRRRVGSRIVGERAHEAPIRRTHYGLRRHLATLGDVRIILA